jgi:hypothetical protein
MEASIVFILAVFASVAAAAFRWPRGVYRRTAIYTCAAAVGALALALLASLVFNPSAGLGLAMMLLAFWFFVIVAAAAAMIGATLRHLLDAARR